MNHYYEELQHTADWSIRVWGEDINQLFENAAAAMFHLQGADLEKTPTISTNVDCQAGDLEALLIAWLSELLYLSELNDALYTWFQVQVVAGENGKSHDEEWTLQARIRGLPGRGSLAHIKAVTYYQLRIRQVEDRWDAVLTFDT